MTLIGILESTQDLAKLSDDELREAELTLAAAPTSRSISIALGNAYIAAGVHPCYTTRAAYAATCEDAVRRIGAELKRRE